MTQFSFGWILSLNWLCQQWGQVQDGLSSLFVIIAERAPKVATASERDWLKYLKSAGSIARS
jgi:hypothetical protein